MDIILAAVKCQKALVYLDNVVIFFRSPEGHLQHVESVLQILKMAGITLKLKKFFFFLDAVDYLGHVIKPERLHIATKKKQTLYEN